METKQTEDNTTSEDKKKYVGRSYIGSKEFYRMVVSPKDYRPLCLHKHESEDEALQCEEALQRHTNGEVAQ